MTDNLQPGDIVSTPTGRLAVVKKLLSGASKHDPFDRVVCMYIGGTCRDLVTLQAKFLKKQGSP